MVLAPKRETPCIVLFLEAIFLAISSLSLLTLLEGLHLKLLNAQHQIAEPTRISLLDFFEIFPGRSLGLSLFSIYTLPVLRLFFEFLRLKRLPLFVRYSVDLIIISLVFLACSINSVIGPAPLLSKLTSDGNAYFLLVLLPVGYFFLDTALERRKTSGENGADLHGGGVG